MGCVFIEPSVGPDPPEASVGPVCVEPKDGLGEMSAFKQEGVNRVKGSVMKGFLNRGLSLDGSAQEADCNGDYSDPGRFNLDGFFQKAPAF